MLGRAHHGQPPEVGRFSDEGEEAEIGELGAESGGVDVVDVALDEDVGGFEVGVRDFVVW